jgi:transposase
MPENNTEIIDSAFCVKNCKTTEIKNLPECLKSSLCKVCNKDLNTFKSAHFSQLTERALIISYISEGKNYNETAVIMKKNPRTIKYWSSKWKISGFNGLKGFPYTGRKSLLTEKQEQELITFVKGHKDKKNLSCKFICQWVNEKNKKIVSPETVRRLLHKNNCHWKQ